MNEEPDLIDTLEAVFGKENVIVVDEVVHPEVVVTRESMEAAYPQAILVLEKYAEWLNLWFEQSRNENPEIHYNDAPNLTIDDFFKWNETRVLGEVDLPSWYGKKSLVIQAGYGDDGGAATLFAVVEDDLPGGPTPHWEVINIMQEFDSSYTTIWTQDQRTGKYHFKGHPKDPEVIRMQKTDEMEGMGPTTP